MAEIKAILEKHDIAGGVVLHTPGFAEYLLHISPSYSCAKFTDTGTVHFRAKAEDFPGGVQERNKVLADTSNMLRLLLEANILNVADPLMNLSEGFDKIVDAEHGPGRHSGHNQQNN